MIEVSPEYLPSPLAMISLSHPYKVPPKYICSGGVPFLIKGREKGLPGLERHQRTLKTCLECPPKKEERVFWESCRRVGGNEKELITYPAFLLPSGRLRVYEASLEFKFSKSKKDEIRERLMQSAREIEIEKFPDMERLGKVYGDFKKFKDEISKLHKHNEFFYFMLCSDHSEDVEGVLGRIKTAFLDERGFLAAQSKFGWFSDKEECPEELKKHLRTYFSPQEVSAKIRKKVPIEDI